MIKRFSVLYVGQIDLENTGLDGTPADERRYPNERLVGAYDNAVALAQAQYGARVLGFRRGEAKRIVVAIRRGNIKPMHLAGV